MIAMEALTEKMKNVDAESLSSELLVRFCSKRPSWKESNFQVYLKTIQLIDVYISKCGFSHEGNALLIPSVIDKLSDIKIGPTLSNVLTSSAEYVGLNLVMTLLAENGKSQKNPKTIAEILKWMQTNLYLFGISGVSSLSIMTFAKEHVQSSNPIVRSSAIKLAVTLYQYYGLGIVFIYLI